MTKKSKRFLMVGAVILSAIAALTVVTLIYLPKPQQTSDSKYDLSTIPSGTYYGECDNGLVFASVSVEVNGHAISDIQLLEHRNGKGAAAEAITVDIVNSQSIEVDAVSGATLSSQTILMAVQNALSEVQSEALGS